MPTPPGARTPPTLPAPPAAGFGIPDSAVSGSAASPFFTYAGGPSSGFSMYSPSFSVPSTSFQTS